jgi:hypothetical protein
MRQEKREDEQLEREDLELGTTIQRAKHEKRENGIEELGGYTRAQAVMIVRSAIWYWSVSSQRFAGIFWEQPGRALTDRVLAWMRSVKCRMWWGSLIHIVT